MMRGLSEKAQRKLSAQSRLRMECRKMNGSPSSSLLSSISELLVDLNQLRKKHSNHTISSTELANELTNLSLTLSLIERDLTLLSQYEEFFLSVEDSRANKKSR